MVKPKNKYSLSHVRHDPAHCLAPGLFRALKRGERKRSKLDVTYDYGDGKRIEFKGPEPLGADDLRILQGLVAMAGPNGLVLSPEPKTEGGQQLWLFLEPKWEAVTADAMVVKGSYRALAREIGYAEDGGSQFKAIRECIERLWTVSIIAQNGRKRQGFRLLAEYASDEAGGRLYVALNPLIAQAVMGGGQHVRISMDEVRALDSEAARLLHQRLCGWIDPGKTGKAAIDTLCGYVWPSEASGSTMRKRRQRVREALPELVALGWTVTEFAAGKYDNKHRRIDCKNVYTREPYISQIGTDKVGKNILRCYISNGTNAYTTQYYNVSNGKVSNEYKGEVCFDEKRVAYIDYKDGKTILEVKKIFDKKPFFEKELDMGGISTATFIGKGEFDGNSIIITHAKGKNYKDVREIFSLN